MEETFKKEKKSIHRKIYEYTPEDDIKYRGPLSYRMLKIVGWIALAFSQYLLLAKLQNSVLKVDEPISFGNTVNGIIVDLALPLLLFGNFALLLNGQNKFRTHFLINGGASLAFIIVYLYAFLLFLGVAGGVVGFIFMKEKISTFNFFVDLCGLIFLLMAKKELKNGGQA